MAKNRINSGTDKRRVRGAVAVRVADIAFRSKLESRVYMILKGLKLNPHYEPTTFTIMDGFTWDNKKYMPITYTPDIIVIKNNINYIIECKGYATEVFMIKKKLFMNYLCINGMTNYKYIIIKNENDLVNMLNIIEEGNHVDKERPIRNRLLRSNRTRK